MIGSISHLRGGIVCRNCESVAPDRGEIDVRLLRIIQTILRLPRAAAPQRLPRLTRHQTDPINRMLIVHIEQTLSKHLRTSAYVAP